jgi:ATP-dependent Clp endopeptidase proteolytic subunit ClpP
MAAEILIYGEIGEWKDWWTGETYGTSAESFRNQLSALEKDHDEITIRINSPGGSVFDGNAIVSAIQQSSAKITCVCDGIAYSMGAAILMAGETVKASKHATIMIHNVSGGVWGNANDLRGALEMMEKLDGSYADIIAEKTGQSREDIMANYFDYRDHTLSAEEALAEGMIDELIEAKSKAPEGIEGKSHKEVIAAFRAVTAKGAGNDKKKPGWWAQLVEQVRAAIKPEEVQQQQQQNTEMTFEDVIAVVNDPNATAEQRQAAVQKLTGFNQAEKFTREEVDAQLADATKPLSDQITALTTERDQWKAKAEKPVNGAAGDPPAGADPSPEPPKAKRSWEIEAEEIEAMHKKREARNNKR